MPRVTGEGLGADFTRTGGDGEALGVRRAPPICNLPANHYPAAGHEGVVLGGWHEPHAER
ncbi:hypothetical protein GCM10010193_40160 [Kitasatospora atroaurantiaca]|uniref:hypothetical protein n=1 Tax=Kitasatospora atroaurantiaca TaxID=285545 RepID=UPI0011A9A9EC|nr:hypothetical protein [Kitasatospora atroaurantiaca]